jgi:hypothetical protein
MPLIRVSDKTKEMLNSLMSSHIQFKLDNATSKERADIIRSLVLKKYGISYDDFLNHILNYYSVNTNKNLNIKQTKKQI